ncbi:HlyD family secretion protein [Marinilongibacter aquaticus]|uniref:HlyD family secretion protein n=1 Tax=Marinilongibacter aquaticus TaxID=2975157 RepID=UPI0021BD75BE|nr:HlyD family secretion protein [Marinilongibacter aquaticus]UBM58921.1 HlyD family secretion protein [Marinilongibacter aquaticus]
MRNYLTDNIESRNVQNTWTAFDHIYRIGRKSYMKYWLPSLLIVTTCVVLLPWTQNIRAKGYVTMLNQENRPQELHAVIAGRVEKWNFKEGDFVEKGDTVLQLTEVKVEYFDPQLVGRTADQVEAKKQSVDAYAAKASTASRQIDALQSAQKLKMLSLDNKIGQQFMKISSDSVDLVAAQRALGTYERQWQAAQVMLDSGAISKTDYEKRLVQFQNGNAKVNSQQNKLNQSRQELLNLRIERNAYAQEYLDKIAKAEGDRFASLSTIASTNADISKLENQLANYDARSHFYFVTATQSGQLTKVQSMGLGELVKEGQMIAEIVPNTQGKAVELFIAPMDLPLISLGQKVRFVFDGFPAIVFSGWPNGSYGTFGGIVSAIETSVSPNGQFRVLVSEDPNEQAWPTALRIGGGANGIALLRDVPIYYELWRNINGFPPEFYRAAEPKIEKKK